MTKALNSPAGGLRRAAAVAAATLATAGLAGAPPAAAHVGDALHQHGWSAQMQATTQIVRCTGSIPAIGQVPMISHMLPDVMTSPGGKVWFTAALDWWVPSLRLGGTTPAKPWAYSFANARGLQYGWSDYATGGPVSVFVWRGATDGLHAGNYYRVHYYYYWEADGKTFYDDTQSDWCRM